MTEAISGVPVAVSLMRETLNPLDGSADARAAALLQPALDAAESSDRIDPEERASEHE